MAQCPECGRTLIESETDGEHQVRCPDAMCVFNFEDQSCPQCGERVTQVESPHEGEYVVTCGQGHHWVRTD